MSGHTYKIVEVVGSSPNSIEEAISTAVGVASENLQSIGWFEVVETRGHVRHGQIAHFQVTLKIGFTLEGS